MYKKLYIYAACLAMLLVCAGCSLLDFEGGEKPQSASPVIISEVVTSNSTSFYDETLGKPDWLELYNTSDSPVSLAGYGLTDTQRDQYLYTFPEITIPAKGYIVVCCRKQPDGYDGDLLCTGFKLSKTGTLLLLSDAQGNLVQSMDVPALITDASYGLCADGKYRFFAAPTAGSENAGSYADSLAELEHAVATGLVINEVLPEGENGGWAELRNASDAPIDLSAYFITDNNARPDKARLPMKQLQPGECITLDFLNSGKDDSLPFSIGGDEHALWLYDSFAKQVDYFEWDAALFPGMSAGRSESGLSYYYAPTPGEANSGDSMDGGFELASGVPNVRINEILRKNEYSITDGSGRREPWAELYNTTGEALTLDGYYLSDESDKFKYSLTGVTIGAGEYMVIFLSGNGTNEGGELHTPFKLSDTDDNLTLTSVKEKLCQTVPLHGGLDQDNVSYGDGGEAWLYFAQPTPGQANDTQGFKDAADIGGALDFGVRISEVSGVHAAKSGKSDWVELYNGTGHDVRLDTFALSDNKDELGRWPLSGELKDGGYIAIDEVTKDEKNTALGISGAGETLYLSNGGVVTDVFRLAVTRPDVTSGRTDPMNDDAALFTHPTKGEQNDIESAVSGYCDAPAFSLAGGFYDGPVALEIGCKTPDSAIYYTLDGSAPSEESTLYEGPISIEENTPVRAMAVCAGKLLSEETAATFMITSVRHTLPVVCLSISEDDKSYIFASPDRLDKRERAGYVEYYEPGGKLGVRFPAGMRIAGNGTRQYPQRSINLYMRGGYGRSSVHYPFFADYGITDFSSLSLRNMGQDDSYTRMRDAYFSMVVKGMNVDYAESRFAVVYINGRYFGLYELKENQNEDYFAARHDVDRDDIVMVRSNTYVYNGHKSRDIKNVFALSRKDTSKESVFEEFAQKVDEEYFADYLIAQTYFANSDAYNQKYASTAGYDMKWRPMLFDLDFAFMSGENRNIMPAFFSANGIDLHMSEGGQSMLKVDTGLFNGLYKNEGWREMFIERYAWCLNNVLTTEKMLALFDDMYADIKDEMPRTIDKWGRPKSMDKWESETAKLRSIIEKRRPAALSQLKKFFDLTDGRMAELFPNDY